MSEASETLVAGQGAELYDVTQPIAGEPAGKNLLSIRQLTETDIYHYINEAAAAEAYVRDPSKRGVALLPFAVLTSIMKQPSTRTGGSMTTAMDKLGGRGHLFSGMASSSEAKGESSVDSWIALAAQSDILGIRTKEIDGPYEAARAIAESFARGKLFQRVPVINLGNGTDEHPTQALGDAFTLMKWNKFEPLAGKVMAMVGDFQRYRAHRSGMLLAKRLGMTVVAVESPAAPVPDDLAAELDKDLQRASNLDEVLGYAHILVMGRNPDEYDGSDSTEKARSRELAASYASWIIDYERLQQMRPDGIVLHPRPRRNELHPSVDGDSRMWDIEQMSVMTPMRMAILANHLGASIVKHALADTASRQAV